MIDTRLPPLSKRVEVPLYPQKTKLPVIATLASVNKLALLFTKILSCPIDNLLFTASASAGLYGYLKQLNQPNIKVALPAFSCESLIEAVVQAGCIPVFTDIGPNVEVMIKNAKFAVTQGCNYFILPNYFGRRNPPERVMQILERGNIEIILDEAQSFTALKRNTNPREYERVKVVLFSFGISKGVAGTGGGLLYMRKPDKALKSLRRLVEFELTTNKSYFERLRNALVELIYLYSPKLVINLGLKGKFYDRLDLLIERSSVVNLVKIGINPIDAKVAYKNLKRQTKTASKHTRDWGELSDALSTKLGAGSLMFLNGISGVPNIVAVCVNPSERYQLFCNLSLNNIQTTWYYFPMTEVERYSSYCSEALINTPKVSSSIVILPFQWQHSVYQRRHLIQVIKGLDMRHAV